MLQSRTPSIKSCGEWCIWREETVHSTIERSREDLFLYMARQTQSTVTYPATAVLQVHMRYVPDSISTREFGHRSDQQEASSLVSRCCWLGKCLP